MTLEEFIKELEDNHIQEDIESLSPKDRISIWLSAKEFQRAKLMRGNAVPVASTEDDKKIFIQIKDNENNRDTDI